MSKKGFSQLRVAIIHFWLTGMRGGERIVESLCRLFPQADIYTHVVRREVLSKPIRSHPIHTTFIQKFPGSVHRYQNYSASYVAGARAVPIIRPFPVNSGQPKESSPGPTRCISATAIPLCATSGIFIRTILNPRPR